MARNWTSCTWHAPPATVFPLWKGDIWLTLAPLVAELFAREKLEFKTCGTTKNKHTEIMMAKPCPPRSHISGLGWVHIYFNIWYTYVPCLFTKGIVARDSTSKLEKFATSPWLHLTTVPCVSLASDKYFQKCLADAWARFCLKKNARSFEWFQLGPYRLKTIGCVQTSRKHRWSGEVGGCFYPKKYNAFNFWTPFHANLRWKIRAPFWHRGLLV